MKNLLSLFLLVISLQQVSAQRPDVSARCKQEMKKLVYMAGDWKGEANIRDQSGVLKVAQTEHIEFKLDSLVLNIEGIGREGEKITFHALANINYDVTTQAFQFRSYVKEGFSTNAYFKILEENKFEWGFDIPSGGKSRYTIILNPSTKTWKEVGEYSRDGQQWYNFIEMNLTKI
ncbi:DUF1579 domain-containing protein [Chryseotalea sanaruensis]|uniref:DUF1579 domain-containing protein n=1 Tax=Chryseotalea sanaruensis TaxID=2482724 RepID=A0A401U702_9BACT|nr:hypothetical protein [Chryseotalea sanaruensis]GCC50649.1 DUF1579 domain-containing protein [Chryseotalea sanaruensis]